MARIEYMEGAIAYERRLAAYLLTERYGKLNEQFGLMAKNIWTQATSENSEFSETNIWKTLGGADETVVGAAGENREALQKVVDSGNIRERVTLLFFGSIPQPVPGRSRPIVPFKELARDWPPVPGVLSEERTNQRETRQGSFEAFVASEVLPPLSEAEKSMTGNDEDMPWVPGGERFNYRMERNFQQESEQTGGLVAAGTSGTSYWLMRQAHHMNEHWGARLDLGEVRLALVATMIQNQHHTYHEVMLGVDRAMYDIDPDRSKYPNMVYNNSFERYHNLFPLDQEQLRDNVAHNRMFPDEHAMQKAQNAAKRQPSRAAAAHLLPVSTSTTAANTASAPTSAKSPPPGPAGPSNPPSRSHSHSHSRSR